MVVVTGRGGATGIRWVEVRGVATKNYQAPNADSGRPKKPALA